MTQKKHRHVGGQIRRDVKEYLLWRIIDDCREKKELIKELKIYFGIPKHSGNRILEEMTSEGIIVGASTNLLDLRQTIFYLPEEDVLLCQI